MKSHLVQVEVGCNDAVEGEGESHQAGWKFKADKSSQHLMMKYDGDGDDDGFDSVVSSEDHLARVSTWFPR